MAFSDLGLSDDLLRAISEAGYTTPTPIQEQAIPVILMGRDMLGCAQTGTGKTASFAWPMLDILSSGTAKARMPRALVLEPTRELAAQVVEAFEVYGKNHKLTTALLIGGESLDDQVKAIDRGPDMLIATPGRLLDLFDRGRLLLHNVKFLVIDEADRMLDMGFIPDVERIVGLLPKIRTTLMFSATMPPEIRRLADAFLTNPKEISVAPPATAAETIIQGMVMVSHGDGRRPGGGQKEKRDALRRLIESEDVKNALVFCNRKRDVTVVYRSLARHGYDAAQLHGDMSQPARTETLEKFRRNECRLLVCSDVAARGLDIEGMSHVFNFDVPVHAEDYVHRIGRTGRAGLAGHAYTIAVPEDSKHLAAIERLTGVKIPRIDLPGPSSGPVREGKRPAPREHHHRSPREAHPPREQRPPQPPQVHAPVPDATPAPAVPPAQNVAPPAPQAQPHHPRPAQPRHQQHPRHDREPESRVKGLGDHVPAFLQQDPMRRSRSE